MLTFPALLASGTMQATTLGGSVQTASGDGIAATIVVLIDSQEAAIEMYYRVRIQLRVSKPLIYLAMWTLVFRILFHFFRPGWAVLA